MRPADTARRRTETATELDEHPRRRPRWRGILVALAPVVLVVTSGVSLAGHDARLVVASGPGDPTTTVAPTTTAPPATCRNSNIPACGPFRFQPEPGPDSPMTVQLTVEPASPKPGDEVTFRLTLGDPDGVSYGSSVFSFGDSGQSASPFRACDKFGTWEPPGRGAAPPSEVQVVRHTYAAAGAYAAAFTFEAGPFACTDAATGRGDRPYASSATATVTVVVVG